MNTLNASARNGTPFAICLFCLVFFCFDFARGSHRTPIIFDTSKISVQFFKQIVVAGDSCLPGDAFRITSSRHPNCLFLYFQRCDSSRHTLEHNALLRSRRALARGDCPSRQQQRSRHPAPLNRRPLPRWNMGINDTQTRLLQHQRHKFRQWLDSMFSRKSWVILLNRLGDGAAEFHE